MIADRSRRFAEKILSEADIVINGSRPWDIQVRDERLYRRVLLHGSLGLGEAYMDGWWDVEKLDEFFTRALTSEIDRRVSNNATELLADAKARVMNLQSRRRSRHVVEEHYDIGNDLYTSFLDPYNQYTCGFFEEGDDLNAAQERKLDTICRKLTLSPDDRVLDIGCGWGGFARFAAEHYGCHVTGITISDAQLEYARRFCRDLPVDIVKIDYRDLEGTFDKVLVCGMIEHVGYKNYESLMRAVRRVMAENGLFLLHTIGASRSMTRGEPWLQKYIFPNYMLPSIAQLGVAMEGSFVMEDWQNYSAHYDKTLLAWWANFDRRRDEHLARYGRRFFRMWKYYLLSSAGTFRSRRNQLWQIVLSPHGVRGGYSPLRDWVPAVSAAAIS